jgi:hypothetical protein
LFVLTKHPKLTTAAMYIEIEYRNLPSDLFVDIKSTFRCYDIALHIFQDGEEHEYLNGGTADVVVYVGEGLTNLIENDLLHQEFYALIKHYISSTWKKIRDYYLEIGIKLQEDKNYISLNFRISKFNSVEFNLMGNVKKENIARLTDKIFSYLRDKDRIQNDLNNPVFKNNNNYIDIISLNFNLGNDDWEPKNFNEYKKKWITY